MISKGFFVKGAGHMSVNEKIAVVVDSCGDVSQEYLEKYKHLFILPMRINCPDGSYRDGVDITAEDIYKRQKTEHLTSSTPSGADVEELFQRIEAEGYNKAIVIILSSGLTSTVQHIRLMAEDLENLEVEVYDSMSGSIGEGAIGIQAAEYIAEGISFDELKRKVEYLISSTRVYFSIDTLEYLEKGGRIGKVTELAGTLLDIKPIITFDEDGELHTAAKVRSHKAVAKKLVQFVQEQAQEGRAFNLVVADGGIEDERNALEARLMEALPGCQHIFRAKIGGALSIHLGPGLLGAGIQYLD